MFTRQGIGISSPFQQPGALNPLQQGAIGLSGRCPVCGTPANVSNIFQQPSTAIGPFPQGSGLGILNPQASQMSGYSGIPFAGVQTPGFGTTNPPFTPQIGAGLSPLTNPLVAAQVAANNPALLSYLVQQSGGVEFAGQPLQGATGQWGASSGVGFGPLGQQSQGAVNPNILAQVLANPAIVSDPVVGPLVAQQLNPWAQQQLPIRSLVGQQQFNPFQANAPGAAGSVAGQAIDPYTALVQAQLISQLAAGPYQHMLRSYAGSPWFTAPGLPFTGQAFPFTQPGAAFGM